MKSLQWLMCGCLVAVGLVYSPAVRADKPVQPGIAKPGIPNKAGDGIPTKGMIGRYQNLQKRNGKQIEQMQKAYQEWSVKMQAEAALVAAEHRAELLRRKAKLEEDRAAKSAKIKQRNEEAATNAKSHEKPKTSSSDKDAKIKAGDTKANVNVEKPDAPANAAGDAEKAEVTATEKPKVTEKPKKVEPGAKVAPPVKK